MVSRSKPKQKKGAKSAPRAKAKVRKAKARPIVMRGQETRWPREIKLDRIILRRDMGDLHRLAKSIDDRNGLLHPVVITPEGFLIAGQRRLAAWPLTEKFKKEAIPVRVIDVDSILAGESDENALRKDFTPSEMVEIHDALIVEAQLRAKDRQAHGKTAPGKKATSAENAPVAEKGAASDVVASALGRDRKTLARAKEVVEAAKADPERFGSLLDRMDKTGNVNGPFRVLKVLRQVAEIKKKKAAGKLDLPEGQFDRIAADAPWPYEDKDEQPDERGRAVRGYATMSLAQLEAMPVKDRLAKDCVCYFWINNYHLALGSHLPILRAWGFDRFPTIITWAKAKIGKGQRLREQTEHCIIAIKGKPVWNLTNQSTLLTAPGREDSRKPDEFYKLVDEITPAQRSLDLFAREPREGWEGFGDQVGKFKAEKIPAPVVAKTGNGPVIAALPQCVWTMADPRFIELDALITINNGLPVSDDIRDGLRKRKLITGKSKLCVSGLGQDRLRELQAASIDPANATSGDGVNPGPASAVQMGIASGSITYTVAGMRDQIDAKTLDIIRLADERGLIQWQADGEHDHSIAFVVSVDGTSFEAVSADAPHLPDYETAIELKRRDGKVELTAFHDEHHGGRGIVFQRLNMPFDRVAAFLRAWGGIDEPASNQVEKIDMPAPAPPTESFDDGIPEILRRKPVQQPSEVV